MKDEFNQYILSVYNYFTHTSNDVLPCVYNYFKHTSNMSSRQFHIHHSHGNTS